MNSKINSKRRSYNFGISSELISILYLTLTGHRILAWRYKTHLGEIDIIAKRGAEIKFIEVKARKDKQQIEVLTSSQKKRISDAAKLFLQKNTHYSNLNLRFDLIIFNSGVSLKYIKNAWEAI